MMNVAAQIREILENANTVAIISHKNPDADTVGSNLALREILEKWGKKVFSFCRDPIPSELNFLRKANEFQQEFDVKGIDAIICVDSSSTAQTVFLEKYSDGFPKKTSVINIDHHPSNNRYGTINLVVPESASTTLIIYRLFQVWHEKPGKEVATSLLCGLYSDTGSFMHPNTCDQVYHSAGELLKLGADINLIVKNLFHTQSIEKLKIWGKILSEIKKTDKNIVFSAITEDDFIGCQAKVSDSSGAIDYLSMVQDNLFTVLLTEDNNGNIRGSLRTRNNNVNLSEIAGMLGGGGHKQASGFCIEGRLKKETIWKIENIQ